MGAFFNFLPFAIIIVSPLKNLFGKIISDGAQHIQASDGMPHVDGFLFEGDPTFCFGYVLLTLIWLASCYKICHTC